MAQRFFMSGNPPRLITSKPGFNASPALADSNKTFDSDWFFGGGIKFHLVADSRTDTSVSFPYALSYMPAILGMQVMDMDKYPVRNMWGGISTPPGPPQSAKVISLFWNGDVSPSGISGIQLQTNDQLNYKTIFLVFEG